MTSHEKMSSFLNRTAADLHEDNILVGVLLYRLRRRSFGGLLFFLAILSLIPGISMFSGLIMIILGVQLSLGFRAPRLPRFISEYSLKTEHLKIALNRAALKTKILEKHIKPRFLIFTSRPFTFILGILVLFLAILIAFPLPFTNLLPALAVLTISLALLEQDGLMILVGASISVIAFILGGTAVYLTFQALEPIL